MQKDIVNCCAKETTERIMEEFGDDYFAIFDEPSDVPQKLVERFLGLVHVGDTTFLSLRSAIMSLLVEYSLSPSKILGQGYDWDNKMKGEINGLKTLIRKDTPRAYYVHCFAHQPQLTLVAIARRNNYECAWLFDTLAILLNVIGVSGKRREMIRETEAQKVAQALEIGELETGSGLNRELGLKRSGETRWGSHFKTLLIVMNLFSTIVEVLVTIGDNGNSDEKAKIQGILYSLESFDFVCMAQLMINILEYTLMICVLCRKEEIKILLML
ncbi:hypothetical protein OROGR_012379 [Orobanche gracilis]